MYTQEEKTWAALAHASILLNLFTAVGGPVAAFLIWLIKRESSSYVGFQALQSLVYQLAILVLGVLGGLVATILSAVVVGICCWLLLLPAGLAAMIYGCYGAYMCSQGADFRYWLIADLLTSQAPPPSTSQ